MTAAPTAASAAAKASGLVLLTLATRQFVMALDTTVMHTAIATVAEGVGTQRFPDSTVSGGGLRGSPRPR